MGLSGSVRNSDAGVVIECQGDAELVKRFETELLSEHPVLASIRGLDRQEISPTEVDPGGFHIGGSASRPQGNAAAAAVGSLAADVTADSATCPACVRDILCPTDRRYSYALTNCTDCGPRYSIIQRVPYDRCNTTMAHFGLCPTCREEYSEPADRRFHAQPIACPNCGPVLSLVDRSGDPIVGDPIEVAQKLLLNGKILAIKGLGGFHLAVRADDQAAVLRLRDLKKRDHKPFALMAASIESARQLVELSDAAVAMMQSPACPIMLAVRRDGASVAEGVAPGSHRLGVMLPYTPVHHLLLRSEKQVMPALVMTSGNASDEPLVIDNLDAIHRLGALCDAMLWHDRPIRRGVDDSVVIDIGQDAPIFVRRARGYVPKAIPLPVVSKLPGICLGGELKSTIAVVRDGSAILSEHLGDLNHPLAFESFRKTAADLQDLFGITPKWIAHDLHPMYVSTIYAKKLAAELNVPLVPVQHHHAHAASVMAEHGVKEKILALVCDGTGYGPDGSIWGGELLTADLSGFMRLATLRPLRLPGGDAAARDLARCGLALLYQAFGDGFADCPEAHRLVPDPSRRAVLCRMIRDDIAAAHSSGAGRYFDGIAALLDLCSRNHFEAQAAMALEAAAHRHQLREYRNCARQGAGTCGAMFQLHVRADGVSEVDLSLLVRQIVRKLGNGASIESLSHLFHEQFARAWAAAILEASIRTGLRTVGLSGGVFCNAWLTQRLTRLLSQAGLSVLRHRVVPPNDGGISLGQAAIAAALVPSPCTQGEG